MLREDGRLRGQRVDVLVVEEEGVDLIRQAAGGAPGNANDHNALSHGAQGVDHVQEVGIPGHEHEGADVGVGMGALNAVGGHLDVDAVLDAVSAHSVGGRGLRGRDASGDEDGLDTGGVEGRRVVVELAGATQLGGSGDPIGVGLGYNDASLVGDFFPEGGEIGASIAGGETDLEVFPVDEESDIVASGSRFNHLLAPSRS